MRCLFCLIGLGMASGAMAADNSVSQVVLAIHGGVAAPRKELSADEERRVRAALAEALAAGYAELQKPERTSLDAVEVSIRLLEDSPLFNAGKGAVFTRAGRNELDAAITAGRDKRAGAVACVTTIKNPITAARAVMEKSKHVLFVAGGAEDFAAKAGLEIVDPKYFWTEPRWKQLQEQLKAADAKQSSATKPGGGQPWGTVGAVAVDRHGDLAAGTSTGGMSGKMPGRIGDSPIIGAGTYADNRSCAVSATGHGEYFIRYTAARDIAALVEYKGLAVADAARQVIHEKLKPAGGEGAVIVLDAQGNLALSFNTAGLFRGYVTRDGAIKVLLYDN